MKQGHSWVRLAARVLLPLIPALTFAMPVWASQGVNPPFTDPAGLADPSEPGSMIVYQKFQNGFVTPDPQTGTQPRALIELGATCPIGTVPGNCPPNEIVIRTKFTWVCPPQPDAAGNRLSSSGTCPQNDFFLNITVGGKLWFDANGTATQGDLPGQPVAAPLCVRGYLIGWVVNVGVMVGGQPLFATPDAPLKLDALIGDVIYRNTPTDLQAIKAVGIQGDPNAAQATPIATTTDANGATVLPIDGNPGSTPAAPLRHYQGVVGQFSSDVRFDSDTIAPFADTALIFLTLDVNSNGSNSPTAVSLVFYDADQTPISEFISFTCWGQIKLTTIDANLQFGIPGSFVLSPRGQVETFQAHDFNTGVARTMIGATQVTEGSTPGPAFALRSYTLPQWNNSVLIPTQFLEQ